MSEEKENIHFSSKLKSLTGVPELVIDFADFLSQAQFEIGECIENEVPSPQQSGIKEDEDESIPLVLIEGFMGPAYPRLYWGPLKDILYENKINSNNDRNNGVRRRRRCLFVSPGPGNSLHDRAVEVYYQLKGGKVDYGEEHSKQFGHARYGREYKGLYPEWSLDKPLHFFGHSLGGTTIWKLQQLLNSNFFPVQHNPHPDMILSLTAISAPFKGSQASYNLGQKADTTGQVVPYSFGYWLGKFAKTYEYFDIKWLKKNVFDFQLEHWNESSMFKDKDHAPYDLSIHGMKDLNAKSRTFTNTFYRTYAASMTYLDEETGFHKPKFLTTILPLYYTSKAIGCFRFPENAIDPPVKSDELLQWFENDGICPVISQYHPEQCSPKYCTHHQGMPGDNNNANVNHYGSPGVWDVWMLPDTTHLGLFPAWRTTKKHRQFFNGLKEYLNALDDVFLKKRNGEGS